MFKKLLSIIVFCFAMVPFASAQTGNITGTVIDSTSGKPLPGTNVTLKSINRGATTNVNGKYEITNIPAGTYTLRASFIGYKTYTQKVKIGSGEVVVNIQMQPSSKSLKEMVVTGYGEVQENNYTGSSSKVSNKNIEDEPVTSVGQTLNGNVAGLTVSSAGGTPGAVQSIHIRGVSSINAGTAPLYVIDGEPVVSGSYTSSAFTTSLGILSNLDPSDIKSVTILKGPVATAPYGARGANGVVVITTKEGQSGGATYTASVQRGWSNPAVKGPKLVNAKQWDQFYRAAVANDPSNNLTPEQVESPWDGKTNSNWKDVVRNHNAPEQKYTLSAQGGNDQTTFYASGGYFKEEGSTIGTGLKRFSGKLNISHKLDERVSLSNKFTGSYDKQEGALAQGGYFGNPVSVKYSLIPIDPIYNKDGTLNLSTTNFAYNPIYINNHNIRSKGNYRVLNNTTLDVKILDNFSFSTNFAIDLVQTTYKNYENKDYGSGVYLGGRVVQNDNRNFNYVWKNTLNYNWAVNQNNHFDFKAISESQRNYYRFLGGQGNGTTDGLSNLSTTATPSYISGSTSDWADQSFTGLVNYSYKDKYLLNGSVREEANSRLAPQTRWGTFWSVGVGYVLSNDKFMQDIPWLNYFKIRITYGKTGNASIGLNNYQTTVGIGSYNGNSTITPNGFGNKSITWEDQKEIDAGINFHALSSRLDGSVTFYRKNSYNLLYSVPLSRTTGQSSQTQNLGKLYNQGLEIELNANIVQGDNVTWNVGANFTRQKNEVTYLPKDINGHPRQIVTSQQYYAVEGYPVGSWYMQEWAGVDPQNGDPLWYMDDGHGGRTTTNNYNEADSYYQGASERPTKYGGINTQVSVFGFYVSANLYYAFGNKIYNSLGVQDGSNLLRGFKTSQLNYWKEPGDHVPNPKPIQGGNKNSASVSSRFLKNGSYLRLKTIRFGYNIPAKYLNNAGISSLNIYFLGRNLWTNVFDKDLEVDPTGNVYNGRPLKTVTMGIKVKF